MHVSDLKDKEEDVYNKLISLKEKLQSIQEIKETYEESIKEQTQNHLVSLIEDIDAYNNWDETRVFDDDAKVIEKQLFKTSKKFGEKPDYEKALTSLLQEAMKNNTIERFMYWLANSDYGWYIYFNREIIEKEFEGNSDMLKNIIVSISEQNKDGFWIKIILSYSDFFNNNELFQLVSSHCSSAESLDGDLFKAIIESDHLFSAEEIKELLKTIASKNEYILSDFNIIEKYLSYDEVEEIILLEAEKHPDNIFSYFENFASRFKENPQDLKNILILAISKLDYYWTITLGGAY